MVNMAKKRICLLIFFLFFLFTITPEENMQKVIIPRKMYLFLDITGNITDPEKLLLQESLLILLSESSDLLIMEPVVFKAMSEEEMNTFVKKGEGDCWLQIKFNGEPDKLTIKASSYDLFENKYIIKNKTLEKDRKIRGITRGFWRDIYTDIEAGYHAIEELKQVKEVVTKKQVEEIVTISKGINLIIEGLPGTTITGAGDKPVLIGEDGKVTVDLAKFSTYNIRASKAGYYPVKTTVYITDKEKSIVLEQKPGLLLGGDIYLQSIDYPGVGIFYYLLPDSFFLELGATFYQFKLMWPVPDEDINKYSLPLTHLFLNAGFYILPADSFISVYLSTGAFIRLIGLGDKGIVLDPLSPWGLKILAINAEIFLFKNVKPFFEYGCLFYFTQDGRMMEASLTDVNSRLTNGYIFTDKLVIDMVHIQAGVRIQFP